MIRAGLRSLSDLDKAQLCCGRGITYPADLSGRGAKTGRAGWAAGKVKGSLFGLGVLLPRKWPCHWTGTLRLLWALRISPSCVYVALGKCPTWPSSKVSLWDLWPLVAQLSCFTHQIFGEALLLLIRSCWGPDVGNLKTEGPTFTFKTKDFSITFASRDKEASDSGNWGSRVHYPHWQQCHNRQILTGTSNPLLYKRVHSFHFGP